MHRERRVYSMIQNYFNSQRDWYRIHETEKGHGALRVNPNEADFWNQSGWGIFHTVNSFQGGRRKQNLNRINAWAIDIDCKDKDKKLEQIENAPILPSLIVETKNGFHVYWNAKNAKLNHYQDIVLDRLIPYFKADERAKDIARLLRVPGFYHIKNPKDPYMVSVKGWNNCAYTEKDMFYAFPLSKEKEKEMEVKKELKAILRPSSYGNDDLWENVFQMDCEMALRRLSGRSHVGGEQYSFQRVANGNLNIYVNNKSTSCWIDKNKRIGSPNGGGPTVFQWLKWFGLTNARVVEVMKKEFPELWSKN